MVPGLTLVLTYYDAPEMLARHLLEFRDYPPGIALSICDDGSEIPPRLDDCPIPYRHYRIPPDGTPWRQNAARNVAMRELTGWCLMTDIDHVLPAAAARTALQPWWRRGHAYRPRRVWPDGRDRGKRHPNSYLMLGSDYWAAGGMDEQVCGYYGTDAGFRRQLERAGIRAVDTDAVMLALYEGTIEDATADLPRKGSQLHAREYESIRRRVGSGRAPSQGDRFRFGHELVEDRMDDRT